MLKYVAYAEGYTLYIDTKTGLHYVTNDNVRFYVVNNTNEYNANQYVKKGNVYKLV